MSESESILMRLMKEAKEKGIKNTKDNPTALDDFLAKHLYTTFPYSMIFKNPEGQNEELAD